MRDETSVSLFEETNSETLRRLYRHDSGICTAFLIRVADEVGLAKTQWKKSATKWQTLSFHSSAQLIHWPMKADWGSRNELPKLPWRKSTSQIRRSNWKSKVSGEIHGQSSDWKSNASRSEASLKNQTWKEKSKMRYPIHARICTVDSRWMQLMKFRILRICSRTQTSLHCETHSTERTKQTESRVTISLVSRRDQKRKTPSSWSV